MPIRDKLTSLFKTKTSQKIFCIGLNKTGTTSLGAFFEQEGYKVAPQRKCELLLQAYIDRDFSEISRFCNRPNYDVFQDVPFSLPYTYPHLSICFPNSKFILTVRDSPDDWYHSILKFHSNFYNKGKTPTKESLNNSKYVYQGWSWDLMNEVFFKDLDLLYYKNEFMEAYSRHNETVLDFFKNQRERLIVINLSKNDDFKRLCNFFKITTDEKKFPKITSDDIVNMQYKVNFLKAK